MLETNRLNKVGTRSFFAYKVSADMSRVFATRLMCQHRQMFENRFSIVEAAAEQGEFDKYVFHKLNLINRAATLPFLLLIRISFSSCKEPVLGVNFGNDIAIHRITKC